MRDKLLDFVRQVPVLYITRRGGLSRILLRGPPSGFPEPTSLGHVGFARLRVSLNDSARGNTLPARRTRQSRCRHLAVNLECHLRVGQPESLTLVP
nr:hypothetical protein [Streptomyces venezuelae]